MRQLCLTAAHWFQPRPGLPLTDGTRDTVVMMLALTRGARAQGRQAAGGVKAGGTRAAAPCARQGRARLVKAEQRGELLVFAQHVVVERARGQRQPRHLVQQRLHDLRGR